MSADEFRARLREAPIDELLPEPAVLAGVAKELRALGFEVFEQSASPIVIAAGSVERFEAVFGTKLAKMTRRNFDDHSEREVTAVVLAKGSPEPRPDRIPGALVVSVPQPPLLANMPQVTNTAAPVCLDLRNGVAVLTRAKATNKLKLASGKLTKGQGVTVAVVDSGFYRHEFFEGRRYHITRLSSLNAGAADVDPGHHGTYVLANLLVCAPGVDAYGVKFSDVPISGIATALGIPNIRVISLSWYWDVGSIGWASELDSLWFQIRVAHSKGVTVVVAAGNWAVQTFPAMLPEVIAVGGVAVDQTSNFTAWTGTTAFLANATRQVPDLCGIASEINLPLPPINGQAATMSCHEGQTSCATAQVAGVAALLLQKDPTLTPDTLKGYLMDGAYDVRLGNTFSGQFAAPGPDPATGHGLVDAEKSWNLMP
jgi:subtilisin family serine protease